MQIETDANTQVTAEAQWHYVHEGHSEGPIPQSELLKMFAEGRLGSDTPVWTEGMSDWAPATQMEAFQSQVAEVPLVMPQGAPERTLRSRAEAARAQGVPQVRPWVRYFARACDLWICAFVFGVAWGFAGMTFEIPEFVLGLALPFIWVFVEALLLSSWGTSPGKWLLGTWVGDATGKKLSFYDALSRSFSVWFIGLGFCLPGICLVTLIVSYTKLKRQGITSWDREGRCAVIHERIGPVRIAVMVGLFILFGMAAAAGQYAQTL